jgi:molecular chaperone GrpE (heat shock protein)
MALYMNQNEFSDSDKNEAGTDEFKASKIAASKMDEMLLDALEALEQARRLHESTPNPEIKRQAKRILDSLHSSLHQLAPMGIHSVKRLQRVPLSP